MSNGGLAVRIELVLSTFDATWPDLRAAAQRADRAGIEAVWIMDHLSGAVHDRRHALECWTTLAGVAAVTERVRLGSLVSNAVSRNAVLLAQCAATVQAQSGGRLTLGIGAGGGPGTPYDLELAAAGFPSGEAAASRRRRVEETIEAVRQVWSGATSGLDGEHVELGVLDGYLEPDPVPPVLVAGYGSRLAEMAGRVADGFNTSAANPALRRCIAAVAEGRATAGRDDPCDISVWALAGDGWLDGELFADDEQIAVDERIEEFAGSGVDGLSLIVPAPFDPASIEAAAALAQR